MCFVVGSQAPENGDLLRGESCDTTDAPTSTQELRLVHFAVFCHDADTKGAHNRI